MIYQAIYKFGKIHPHPSPFHFLFRTWKSSVSFLIGVSLLFRVRRQKYSIKTEHLIMLISSLGTLDEFDISSGSGTKELNIVHIMV
jgi:hypothetical protein